MGTLEELEIVVAQLQLRVAALADTEPVHLSRTGHLRDSLRYEIVARNKVTGEDVVVGWSQRDDAFPVNRWSLQTLPERASPLTHHRVVLDRRKPDPLAP